jgi:hypothetical protein
MGHESELLELAGDNTDEPVQKLREAEDEREKPQRPKQDSVAIECRLGMDLLPRENFRDPHPPTEIASLAIVTAADASDNRQEQKKADHPICQIHYAQLLANPHDEIKAD